MVRTLHPQLEMLLYTWRPTDSARVVIENNKRVLGRRMHYLTGGTIEEFMIAHGHGNEVMFQSSPFYAVLKSKKALRIPLQKNAEKTPRKRPFL